jgi:hypothetical protein
MSNITRVVLYKHGVGHFERQATVTGDSEVKLAFRTEEMNDVLKSLTVYDQGGGMVSSVSYDNKKPIAKLLADISLDIPSRGGSLELLAALRGADVSVSSGSRVVSGQVVGVDAKKSAHSGLVTERHILTIFDEKGRLQNFDLEEITNVAFLDEALQKDMRFLFTTVFSAKKQDAKALKIFSRGEGERILDISYVVECPVWKTSYRVALAADDAPAYLQGWALVDNPQDEDWKDVELSLVSGLPVSFRHDLYSPRYLHRKEIAVETESASGPVMAESDLFDACLFEEAGEAPVAAMAFGGMAPPGGAGAIRQRSMSQSLRGASTQVETVTQKVGQLFEYKIDRPVTVLRNQSALVPIVSGEFEGGKKLLYNELARAENPYSVVDFKNTTGLTLEGGPVTIYEGDIYAGEAMMDTVGPDEERMLPYSVALEVEAKVDRDTETKTVSQFVSNGIWRQKRALYARTDYRFVNRGATPKTVIVEHSLSQAELVNTPQPTSETRNYWRFTVEVPAQGSEILKVTEKTVHDDKVYFSNATPENITVMIEGAASDVEHLRLVQELKAMLEEEKILNTKVAQRQKHLVEKTNGQARIRANLQSLGHTDEEKRLRSRYVEQLGADETEISSLQEQLQRLEEQLSHAKAAFRTKVGEVTLERIFE